MPQRKANPVSWGLRSDAVEVLEKRTRHAKHFRNPDGTYTAVIGQRMHFQATPGGPWLDPEEMVVQRSAPGTWTVTTAEISIQANYSAMTLTHLPTNTSWQWVFQGTGSGDAVIYNGVPWQYEPSPWGVKSNAVVESRRGPQTYDWLYLSNAQGIHVDAEGNIRAGQFLIRRPFVIGANGVIYECSAWDLSVPAHARFSFDDSTLPPEAFPYRIDPTTTLSVAASGDDGLMVSAQGVTYPPSASSTFTTDQWNQAQRSLLGGLFYSIYTSAIRWDTSSLAGTTPTGATARFYVDSVNNADNRSLTIEWYSDANWPLDNSDYTATAGSDAHAGTPLSSITAAADNDFVLSDAAANINTSGYTGIRIHISGGQPTGHNTVLIAAYDHSTQPEPRLIVDYMTTGAPGEVTLQPAGVTTGEMFGTPLLNQIGVAISPSSIASTEAFGSFAVVPGAVSVLPGSISSAESLANPAIQARISLAASGIASLETLGSPGLLTRIVVAAPGVGSLEALGLPFVSPDQLVLVPGLDGESAVGIPLVVPGPVLIVPVGAEDGVVGMPRLAFRAHQPLVVGHLVFLYPVRGSMRITSEQPES